MLNLYLYCVMYACIGVRVLVGCDAVIGAVKPGTSLDCMQNVAPEINVNREAFTYIFSFSCLLLPHLSRQR